MPHRSTKWRWKKSGRPNSPHPGRRLKQKAREQRTRKLLIKLVNEELPLMFVPDEFREWLNDLLRNGNPVDLIAVAAHDVLSFGRRTRRPDKKRRATLLLKQYPQLTNEQARQFATEDGKWLNYVETASPEFRWIASSRPCCVSKVFTHITRRMACYWRRHSAYENIKEDVRTFSFFSRTRTDSFNFRLRMR
jgi:hypothetical protein